MGNLGIGAILMGLAGGLALFLYGMEKMTSALKLLAGDRMKSFLARMTTNRFKSVLTGAIVTAAIQSSSVTTVLVVGFISAGLLSLSQSIGIILGASIGTTITAQIVAFKITHYALIPVAAGFLMSFASRQTKIQHYGRMIMGLGLIFFGMELMKGATNPLRTYEPFIEFMRNLESPLVGVLFGAAFTALIQSSSATTGVIIVLASQGFLTLESGIALVLGANIGTCVTASLAAIGKPREAVRAALVHVLLATAGVMIWIGLIDQLAEFVRWISPTKEGLDALAKLSSETPRQIANSHTAFNVANTVLFIGFTPVIARFMEWIVPDRKLEADETLDRRYLDDILIHAPSLALDVVRMEMARLGAAARNMVRDAMDPVLSGTQEDLDDLEHMDEDVDQLHGALVTYLGRLSLENLTESQSHRLSEYLSASNYFENIGDMIETNLVEAGRSRLEQGLTVSPSTREILRELHLKVTWTVERATEAIAADDKDVALEVIKAKAEIKRMAAEAEGHLAARLTATEGDRLAVFRIESELVEALRRIYYFAKRIARLVVEETAPYARGGRGQARQEALFADLTDERPSQLP